CFQRSGRRGGLVGIADGDERCHVLHILSVLNRSAAAVLRSPASGPVSHAGRRRASFRANEAAAPGTAIGPLPGVPRAARARGGRRPPPAVEPPPACGRSIACAP